MSQQVLFCAMPTKQGNHSAANHWLDLEDMDSYGPVTETVCPDENQTKKLHRPYGASSKF